MSYPIAREDIEILMLDGALLNARQHSARCQRRLNEAKENQAEADKAVSDLIKRIAECRGQHLRRVYA